MSPRALPRAPVSLVILLACSAEPPRAEISAVASAQPTAGMAPLRVSFSSADSGGGEIVELFWRFGDGSPDSDQAEVVHTFTRPGRFDVELLVIGSAGAEATDQISIHVSAPPPPNMPPSAAISASVLAGASPLAVDFDGGGSVDPEGALVDYVWEFSDGSPLVNSAQTSHVFENDGNYRVTLTVKDSAGATATAETWVTVSEPPCPPFSRGRTSGYVSSDILDEVSGIVASRANLGIIWVHNDSGDGPRVYALDTQAKLLAGYELGNGAIAADWEDIAIGPGPEEGKSYLYVGDIGDNERQSEIAVVYRFEEPLNVPRNEDPPRLYRTGRVDTLIFEYGGGEAYNAEALMADPVTGDLLIVTKSPSGVSKIYRAAAPMSPGSRIALERLGEVNFGGEVTGGDISPSGEEILIRTYYDAVLWKRPPGRSLLQAFRRRACPVRLENEVQGESISFRGDGSGFFTLSEGANRPLFTFDRL